MVCKKAHRGIYEMKNILIISPHPDDETLGAGGTLLKYKDKGYKLYWCNITNIKEEYGYTKEKVIKRQEEIKNVINSYGFDDFFDLSFKPSSLSQTDIPKIINSLGNFIEKIKPSILIIPFYGDAHSDHRVVFEATKPFFKSFRYSYIKKVLMMEIISETDNQFIENFKPNVFVDISDFVDKKLEIMSIYKTEIGKHPFPRSLENIKALATFRGSQCNCKYAESFMLIKEVIE